MEHMQGESNIEQPTRKRIEALQARSKFRRSPEDSSTCTIENAEGTTFSLSTIENGQDPILGDVQALFERTFGEEEIDPEEILRSAVDGVTPWGTNDTKYRVVPVRENNGEVVGTIAGASLDIVDANEKPTNEMAYFIGYAVVDPKIRQGGLAREAYISALMDATANAEKEGKKISYAIGECTGSSEHFWNSVGWKRIYAKDENNEYIELPYIQPALDFDEETGEIAEDAGEAPEHLMIDSFTDTPTKEAVKSVYDSFIRYCAMWPREAFKSDEAYRVHQEYVENLTSKFKEFIDTKGELLFLDAKEREEAIKSGQIIHDHPEIKEEPE
ncbi:hypothetical protein KW782_02585 [Candidatus Parcubacteria bacterium]|nr:hypothetical protein [Candidatus Parcubacteria bacterium]